MNQKILCVLIGMFVVGMLFGNQTVLAEEITPKIETTIDNFYEKYEQIPKTTPTKEMPKFINLDKPCRSSSSEINETNFIQCYFGTNRATKVSFDVMAEDYHGEKINVQCDKISGQIFQTGRTRVQCIAEDSVGSIVRGSFFVTVGYEVVDIPKWLKTVTLGMINGVVTEDEFNTSIEYLMEKGIMVIPKVKNPHAFSMDETPSWVYKTLSDWSVNKTGDHEYSIAISWLIQNGKINQ